MFWLYLNEKNWNHLDTSVWPAEKFAEKSFKTAKQQKKMCLYKLKQTGSV